MNKIPVGKTIEFAYEFTFGNLGAIIGLIWVAMLLTSVSGFFVQTYYYQTFMTAMVEGRSAAAGQAVVVMLVWLIAALLLSAVMYVPVLQQALGLRKGPAYFHFSLGAAEFRLFGAELAFVGLIAFFLIVYMTVLAVLIGSARAAGGPSPIALLLAAAALAGLGFILFAFIRLSFLLLPATLIEEKISLSRSWALTQGNFWRIVVIGLATLGPVMLISQIGQMLIMGPNDYLTIFKPGPTDAATQAQIMAAQARSMREHLPLLLGLQLALAPFLVGLLLAPAAYAYRALVPDRKIVL